MNNRYYEGGFTFIEILIGLFIALLVAGALVTFTLLSFNSQRTVTNSMEEIWESRQAMNQISDEIKYAVAAVPAADNKSLTYLYPDPSDPQATINYRLFIGADNKLYAGNTSFPRAITKNTVKNLVCKYNTSDPQNNTINIVVTFADSSTLSTTVTTLNKIEE